MPLLEVSKVSKYFGGLAAVNDVDLSVNRGDIVGLIGPNGAGKTTLFNLITGFFQPTRGRITFKDEDITGKKPDRIAKKGIVRTFQATILFKERPVLENVIAAHHLKAKASFWDNIFATPSFQKEVKDIEASSLHILQDLGLAHFKDELAKNLPHGHQRILGIAIALAAGP